MHHKWITVISLLLVFMAIAFSVFALVRLFDSVEDMLPVEPGGTETPGGTDTPGDVDVPSDTDTSINGDFSLTLTPSELILELGESKQLTVNIKHENTQLPLIYQSSASEIASVENGIVKAVGIGEATITVQYDDMSASCMVTVLPQSSLTDNDDIVNYNSEDFYLLPSEFAFQTYGNANETAESGAIKFLAYTSSYFSESVVNVGGVFKMLIVPIDFYNDLVLEPGVKAVDWKQELNEQFVEGKDFLVLNCSFEGDLIRCFLSGIKLLNTNRIMVSIPFVEFEEEDYRQYAFVPFRESYATMASSYGFVCSKAMLQNKAGIKSYSEAALAECMDALMVAANLDAGVITREGCQNDTRDQLLEKIDRRLFYGYKLINVETKEELPTSLKMIDENRTSLHCGESIKIGFKFFVINQVTDEIYEGKDGNGLDVLIYHEMSFYHNEANLILKNEELTVSDVTGLSILCIRIFDVVRYSCFDVVP